MSDPTTRLNAIALSLAKAGITEPVSGVEVGVWKAEMSCAMLRRWPGLRLTCVDRWRSYPDGWQTWSQEQMDGLRIAAYAALTRHPDRYTLLEMPSVEASGVCKGRQFDFVFIDADHSFDGCLTDMRAWWPRVRSGGLLCGHDYGQDEIPQFGVTEAMATFIMGKWLQTGAGSIFWLGDEFTWFIQKP